MEETLGIIILLFVILGFFGFFAYQLFYKNSQDERQEALYKMHYLPRQYVGDDYGAWEKKFQDVIAKAIESTTDTAKLSDLKHCQSVVKEMNKSSVGYYTWLSHFSKINETFRLTGCHLKITDSQGKTIAKIV